MKTQHSQNNKCNIQMHKDVAHIYNGLLAIKKNKIMLYEATWMNSEIIILSEVNQRQISYDILYMQNL